MSDLNERIDEFLLSKMESLIVENQELRRLLDKVLAEYEETGFEYRPLWVAEVRKLLGKDAPHVVRQ